MTAPQQYTLPADKLIKAIDFAAARHALYFSGLAFSVLVLVALIAFRVAPRLRDRTPPLVVPAIYLLVTFFDLPGAVCAHWLSLHYGMSIQPWTSWLLDEAKGAALGLLLVMPLTWGFLAIVRRSPRRWWLYAWVCAIPLAVASAIVEPVFVEPLFNTYRPLSARHPELIAPIERILGRAGVSIPPDRLFEMQASEKTRELNAYVSGFGPSRRLVLYDTIIRAEPRPELMTTFGHELGHYVLGHIAQGLVFGLLLFLLSLVLAYVLMHWFVRRWGPRFDVRGPEDCGAVPVYALLALLLSVAGEPIVNAFSRHIEQQADVYSLEVTHGVVPRNGEAAARAFQIEGEEDLEPPHPSGFIVFWLYTHPPIAERLRFALEYDPWQPGGRPRFVR